MRKTGIKKYIVMTLLMFMVFGITGIQTKTPVEAKTSTIKCPAQEAKPSKKIKLNKKKKTIRVGQKYKLKLKNAKAKKVKWKSSDKKVAKVKKGVVTAKKKGKATVTATYKGKKYKCKIKVKKAKSKIENMPTIVPSYTTVERGQFLVDEMYKGKNIVVSPVSLNMVLGMAANGATGKAAEDLQNYLDMSADFFNEYEAKPLMEKAKSDSMLSVANGVWYRDTCTIKPDFQSAVEEYYNASVKKSPFDKTTKDEINQWASDNTDKMIPKIINEIKDDDVAILVNAILFQGKWTEPFEAEYTAKKNFTTFDNKKIKVDMMSGSERSYYENDYATGFEKTYGKNGEYSFIAILPKKTGAFNLSDLDLNFFLASKRDDCLVQIEIPKFSYKWDDEGNLNDTLKKAGLESIFDASINPLGNILTGSRPIYTGSVNQACKIIMDEDGTKAAAVTAMIDKVGAMPVSDIKQVYLNRPFAYIIMDNTNQSALFVGKVVNPNQN